MESLERRLCLSVTFTAPVSYGGVDSPTNIVTADFNSDQKADIAVAGYDTGAGSVPVFGVYLNQGGTFGTPTVYPFTGTPAGMTTGDFQADNQQDIALTDTSTNTLFVFLDQSGNFTLGQGESLGGGSGDTQVVTADFNGDLRDDVAVLDPPANSAQVFISNGDGSFTPGQSISVPSPIDLVTGDFNGDGRPDLAVLSANGSVYVALNQRGGQFSVPVAYSLNLATPATGLLATSLTGGARSDLVAYGPYGGGGEVTALISQSGGTFAPSAPVQLSINPAAVVAGGFTASDSDDLAVLSGDGSLQILPGNGDGTFGTPQVIFTNTLGSGITQATELTVSGSPSIAYISSAAGFRITTDTSVVTSVAQTVSPALTGTLPSSIVSGTAFHARENLVLTADGAAAKGAAAATVLLSPDSSAGDSVLTLGSAGGKVSLKAGRSKSFGIKLLKSIPTTVPAGDYHLLIQLTDTAGVTATIDSGKTLTVAPGVVDLTGSFVKTPASAVAGKKFSFTIDVSNSSSANIAAAGTLPIEIETSPDGLFSDATPLLNVSKRINLKPGKSLKLNFTAMLSSAAYLLVDLDPGNTAFTNDVNPANNLFSALTPITVNA